MVAKLHIAKKELGLDDETYRNILTRVTGKASSKAMTDVQLDAALAEFRRLGWVPKPGVVKTVAPAASGGTGDKIRALWIACWNLGVVRDGSEAALRAFVKRQTKIDDLRFLPGAKAHRVIEGLKAMAGRAGVDWVEHTNPRICVVLGQWRRLRALGALTSIPPGADADALVNWLFKCVSGCRKDPVHLTDAEADKAIALLGRWVRKALAKTAGEG
ncbi:MAG: regulatory protein GemA [Alphaproteobacteria bacterium]|nr:regulatory protein GemA [Alphaproteobacteria bacterium]